MKVRYVGTEKRTNSFGTFDPGGLYDVSKGIGEQLLTAPNLFVDPDKKPEKSKDAVIKIDENKTEDDDENTDGYNGMNMAQLRAVVTERGLEAKRNARKVELVELLEKDDADKPEGLKVGDKVNIAGDEQAYEVITIYGPSDSDNVDVRNDDGEEFTTSIGDLTLIPATE